MPTDLQVAWVAGLYEGEGTIFTQVKPSGHTQTAMSICMVDEDVIRRVAEYMQLGSVTSYQPSRTGSKLMWRWRVGKKDEINTAVFLMWPWLGDRRRNQIMAQLSKGKVDVDTAGP